MKDIYVEPSGLQHGLEEVLILTEGVHQPIPDASTAANGPVYMTPAPSAACHHCGRRRAGRLEQDRTTNRRRPSARAIQADRRRAGAQVRGGPARFQAAGFQPEAACGRRPAHGAQACGRSPARCHRGRAATGAVLLQPRRPRPRLQGPRRPAFGSEWSHDGTARIGSAPAPEPRRPARSAAPTPAAPPPPAANGAAPSQPGTTPQQKPPGAAAPAARPDGSPAPRKPPAPPPQEPPKSSKPVDPFL